jgi:hypothetical protein
MQLPVVGITKPGASNELILIDRFQNKNPTLFSRRFLNTSEEMDAHSGFKGSHERAPGLLEA